VPSEVMRARGPSEFPPGEALAGPAWGDPLVVACVVVVAAASIAAASLLARRLRHGMPLVTARPRRPVPWNGTDVAVVFIGYLVVTSLVISAWTLDRASAEPSLVAGLRANLVVVAGSTAFALAHLRRRGADLESLGLACDCWRADLRLALGGLALVVGPLLGLSSLLDLIVPYRHPLIDLLAVDRSGPTLALVIVTAVVAAPVAEELFFRRILQGWLETRLPGGDGRAAIAVSALCFALAHLGQGLAYLPLFLLGLVLGCIARQTGSIVACTLLHALFNAVSVGLVLATRPAAG